MVNVKKVPEHEEVPADTAGNPAEADGNEPRPPYLEPTGTTTEVISSPLSEERQLPIVYGSGKPYRRKRSARLIQ